MSLSQQELKIPQGIEPSLIKPNVVIVGAGPVGLGLSIELLRNAKEQKNQLTIAILERHYKYVRKQLLKLDLGVINDSEIKADLMSLVESKIAEMNHDQKHINIPIQELEKCLKKHAKDVNIIYQRLMTQEQFDSELAERKLTCRGDLEKELNVPVVVDLKELIHQFPECNIVIGADGAHSTVRQLLITDEKSTIDKKDLRNLIEIKYQVEGKVKKLSYIQYVLTQALLHGFLCHEHVKYDVNQNRTEVTLRFLVDDATYNDPYLEGVNAKNLLPLSKALPAKLSSALTIWVNKRGDKNFIIDSPTLNKTKLSILASKKFCTRRNNLLLMLAGDAACGFPFMNGLNLGLENANHLAALIVTFLENIEKNNMIEVDKFLKQYHQLTTQTFQKGFQLVAKANKKISYQESSVSSLRYSSFPIKLAMQSYYDAKNHPIFNAHSVLDFSALIAYVESKKKNPQDDLYKLSRNLLNELQKKDNDFIRIKTLLCLAYEKNKRIQSLPYFFSIISFFQKTVESQQSVFERSSLETKEFESKAIFDIPSKLYGDNGKVLSQGFHDVIKDLFFHLKRYQSSYLDRVGAELAVFLEEKSPAIDLVKGYLAG